MLVKDLIERLRKHNPDAEVHVSNDRGYYEYVQAVSCISDDTVQEIMEKAHETEEYPVLPDCDDSCKQYAVVLHVD